MLVSKRSCIGGLFSHKFEKGNNMHLTASSRATHSNIRKGKELYVCLKTQSYKFVNQQQTRKKQEPALIRVFLWKGQKSAQLTCKEKIKATPRQMS